MSGSYGSRPQQGRRSGRGVGRPSIIPPPPSLRASFLKDPLTGPGCSDPPDPVDLPGACAEYDDHAERDDDNDHRRPDRRRREEGDGSEKSAGVASSSPSSSYASRSSRSRACDDEGSLHWSRTPSSAAFLLSSSTAATRPSVLTSTMMSSSRSLLEEEGGISSSPHEMAARAAIAINREFVDDLPPMLRENYDVRDVVAPFKNTEIMLGKLLGKGEFSHVYEISTFKPEQEDEDDGLMISSGWLSEAEISARRLMKTRERYRDTNRSSYAVKHLRPNLPERYGVGAYAQAARDVALEAVLLNSLSDPNIIKLRGVSFAGPGGFAQGELCDVTLSLFFCFGRGGGRCEEGGREGGGKEGVRKGGSSFRE